MKTFLAFLAVLALGALQSAFSRLPDFLLICAVIVTLTLPARTAIALCIFAGLLKDSFGANPFGINTVLFTLWCFLILRLNRKITIDNNFMRTLLMFIIAFTQSTINGIILLYLGMTMPPGIFLRIVLVDSLYSMAVFIPVWELAKRFIFENRSFH